MDVRQKGLTLVELMVVVAVMAVIASIAYPLYSNQVQKTRRADAKIALESIAMAQERYYTVNGYYAAKLGSLQVSTAIQGGTSDQGYYSIGDPAVADGAQRFSVTATALSTGAQAGDISKCGTFVIDQMGEKTSTGSLSNCW